MVSLAGMSEGFYSVVRYTPDPVRDEAKNVALMLVDETRNLGRIRVAPLSQVAARLEEHGLLDSLLVGLATRLESGDLRQRRGVELLSATLGPTLSMSPPRGAAIAANLDETLKSLYQAYVAPRRARDAGTSRGEILDRLVRVCRKVGATIEPGSTIEDVLFDAVMRGGDRITPLQILSFDTEAQSPRGIEHAAGYFLYGLDRVHTQGICVLQPPRHTSSSPIKVSFERISRWMSDAGVETVEAAAFSRVAASMAGRLPLPLVMS